MYKKTEVYNMLNNMNIKYKAIEHKAVYTIEDTEKIDIENSDKIAKNLFLRDNKKQNYYLVVMPKNKRADIKSLRNKIQSTQLKFADENDLYKYLGLEKGSVTPLGILNDTNNKVTVIFDNDIFSFEFIGIHPNENTATIWIDINDLLKIIKQHGNNILNVSL